MPIHIIPGQSSANNLGTWSARRTKLMPTNCNSMPNHQLAFGWIGTVEANRKPIRCQLEANRRPVTYPILANPMPIACHLREPFPHLTKEQVLYVGWSLVHSEDEFKTIEHNQFLPIHSSAGQSMPILDNQVPIPGQSVTSYVLNHRTSCLYGMVPSLLGG